LGIALDAGLATDTYPTHFFVTHAHMDHIGELFRYVIDPPNNMKPTVYYPRPSKEYVDEFLQGAVHHPTREVIRQFEEGIMNVEEFVTHSIHMTKHNKSTKIPWRPIGVSIPKGTFEETPIIFGNVTIKNFKFELELFKSTHTIATTGYGFIGVVTGLKPEYRHLIGNQEAINVLKEQGIEVSGEYKRAHFCYLGDTDHRVLYESSGAWNRHLEKYSTIIMECTFLEDVDAKQAKEKKHALLSRILPFIRAHPEINFMLGHFSMKYKDKEVIDFFERLGQPNIIPLISDFDDLQTDTVTDLLKAGNNYATSSVLETLAQLGYTIQAPPISSVKVDISILCQECSGIHEKCTCFTCVPDTCETCLCSMFECSCKAKDINDEDA
jgi:ribonuclease Z